MSPSDYHAKAPICAAFVNLMREVFGQDVKVNYVFEGDVRLGEVPKGFATEEGE